MADPKLPMNGSDAKIVLFYGGARVPGIEGQTVKWTVKQAKTMFRDPIVGRKRLRTASKVDGYDADLDVQVPDLGLFNFLKSIDDSREAKQPLKELAVGLEFADAVGGIEGVLISKCEASFEIANPGQKDRLTGKVTIQGEEFTALTL